MSSVLRDEIGLCSRVLVAWVVVVLLSRGCGALLVGVLLGCGSFSMSEVESCSAD